MSVTIRDIARELKIDPSTVSSALAENYQARRISKTRAALVRQKAQEMGYIPNRLAGRIFRRSRRKNIALILKNDTASTRNQPVLDYALRLLAKRNDCDYSVFCASENDLTDAVKAGLGVGIHDFVVIGYLRGSDWERIDFDRFPPVRIYAADYYFDASDRESPALVCKIGFDREAFYRELTEYLTARGVGPVVCCRAIESGQPLLPDENLLQYRVRDIDDLFRFGKEVLAPQVLTRVRSGSCRTVLFRNDSLAIGALDALLEAGIRIPDELALLGFNDAPFAPYAKVALSSVRLPQQENVTLILNHLLEDAPLASEIRIHAQLILRHTLPAELLRHAAPTPRTFEVLS